MHLRLTVRRETMPEKD